MFSKTEYLEISNKKNDKVYLVLDTFHKRIMSSLERNTGTLQRLEIAYYLDDFDKDIIDSILTKLVELDFTPNFDGRAINLALDFKLDTATVHGTINTKEKT